MHLMEMNGVIIGAECTLIGTEVRPNATMPFQIERAIIHAVPASWRAATSSEKAPASRPTAQPEATGMQPPPVRAGGAAEHRRGLPS